MSQDAQDRPPKAAFDPEGAPPPTGLGRVFVYFKIGITVGTHFLTAAILLLATDQVLSRPIILGVLLVINLLAAFLWRNELKHLTPPEEFED